MSPWLQTVVLASSCVVATLLSNAANADDNEARWRVFDEAGEALLVISDTDEAAGAFLQGWNGDREH
jgi:hypothetical protein